MVPIRPDVASAFRILYLGSLIPFTRLHWDLGRHVKLLVLRLERINHPVFRPIPQPDLWCLSLESCTVPPQVLESKIVMKSAFAIPLAFAICLALVNASAIQIAARAQFPSCTGGEVLEQTTIHHNGNSIQYASATCPGGSGDSGNSAKRSKLEERQTVCTAGGCSITCMELSKSDIYTSDCQDIIDILEANAPGSFTLKAVSEANWTSGTCTITIGNFEGIDYKVCYETVAIDAAAAINKCIGVTGGALCVASQAPGHKWSIQIS